jgi:hypothetical protein
MQKARCPGCGRVLAVQPPRGGDGSVDVFPRHSVSAERKRTTATTLRCSEGRQIVDSEDYVQEVRNG